MHLFKMLFLAFNLINKFWYIQNTLLNIYSIAVISEHLFLHTHKDKQAYFACCGIMENHLDNNNNKISEVIIS